MKKKDIKDLVKPYVITDGKKFKLEISILTTPEA
jgi:hypothetical protein